MRGRSSWASALARSKYFVVLDKVFLITYTRLHTDLHRLLLCVAEVDLACGEASGFVNRNVLWTVIEEGADIRLVELHGRSIKSADRRPLFSFARVEMCLEEFTKVGVATVGHGEWSDSL